MAKMRTDNSAMDNAVLSGTSQGLPPLAGVRVLDLTHVVAGPFATTMLADLGAEVVKLERPGVGDDLRSVGRFPGREDHEDMFNANNRSKKSITLDLKHPDGRELGQRLAAVADVVVENFAPGTVARLGMGWDDLRPLNPSLVYCSLSGFGQTGPYSNRLALDIMIQAMSGLMSVTGKSDGPPLKAGAPLGDVISGMMASYAILGALYAVRRDGVGRYIDVSMQGSLLAALGPRLSQALHLGVAAQRLGNENPMRVPSNTYLSADGHWLAIHVNSQRHWAPFCRALAHEEWNDDARFATMKDRAENRDAMNTLRSRNRRRAADRGMVRAIGVRTRAVCTGARLRRSHFGPSGSSPRSDPRTAASYFQRFARRGPALDHDGCTGGAVTAPRSWTAYRGSATRLAGVRGVRF